MNKDEIILEQSKQIKELRILLKTALVRIAELEAQLCSNSQNSSRLPSSDRVKSKRN